MEENSSTIDGEQGEETKTADQDAQANTDQDSKKAPEEAKSQEAKDSDADPEKPSFDYKAYIETIEDEKKRDYLSRFNSAEDLADAALNLRKELSTRVKKPGKDASDKEQAEYRKAIGAGMDPKDYEVKFDEDVEVSDDDKNVMEVTSNIALKHGIPVDAYNEMAKDMKRLNDENEKQLIEGVKEYTANAEKELQKEYGKEWQAKLTAGQRLAENLGVEGLKEALDAPAKLNGVPVQFGSIKPIREMFIKLGQSAGEDGVIGFKSPDEIKSIKGQIKEFREKYPAGSQGYKDNYAELQALYAKLG